MRKDDINRHVEGLLKGLDDQLNELERERSELQGLKKDVENIKIRLGDDRLKDDEKPAVEPHINKFWSTRLGKGLQILGYSILAVLIIWFWDFVYDLEHAPLAFFGAALVLLAVAREYFKKNAAYRTPSDIVWPFAGVLGALAVLISTSKAWLGESPKAYFATIVVLAVVCVMFAWQQWRTRKAK